MRWTWLKKNITALYSLATVLIIIFIFQALNPSFLSYEGFRALIYAMSYFLIAACGLTFVILMGSFDFSVVSLLKLAAMFCAVFFDKYGMMVIPISLLLTTAFGCLNGLLVSLFSIPSFMATLGVSIVLEGIVLYFSKGKLFLIYDETFRALAVKQILGLPAVFFWALMVWAICVFVALYTPFGRKTYAIGENIVAARLSGIDVEKHRILVFTLSGFLSGLAGVLYMAQYGGGSVQLGADMSVPLFASIVAGGTALTGGIGGGPSYVDRRDHHYMDADGFAHAGRRKRRSDDHFWNHRHCPGCCHSG